MSLTHPNNSQQWCSCVAEHDTFNNVCTQCPREINIKYSEGTVPIWADHAAEHNQTNVTMGGDVIDTVSV